MKTYLVTGGAEGIGKAIVIKLLESHDNKVIVIDKQNTNFIEGNLSKNPDRFEFHQQDISERENLKMLLEKLSSASLSGIVNNAGEVYLEDWDNFKLDTWDRTLSVNLTAPLQIVHALRNSLTIGASIVNIASVDAFCSAFDTIAYAASKAALVSLTKSMAANLGERNVRVNAVAPGWVETEMTKDTLPDESKELTPLSRNAQPEEVAETVKFLLSEKSSFINGTTITIDGGLTTVDYTLFKESKR